MVVVMDGNATRQLRPWLSTSRQNRAIVNPFPFLATFRLDAVMPKSVWSFVEIHEVRHKIFLDGSFIGIHRH